MVRLIIAVAVGIALAVAAAVAASGALARVANGSPTQASIYQYGGR